MHFPTATFTFLTIEVVGIFIDFSLDGIVDKYTWALKSKEKIFRFMLVNKINRTNGCI